MAAFRLEHISFPRRPLLGIRMPTAKVGNPSPCPPSRGFVPDRSKRAASHGNICGASFKASRQRVSADHAALDSSSICSARRRPAPTEAGLRKRIASCRSPSEDFGEEPYFLGGDQHLELFAVSPSRRIHIVAPRALLAADRDRGARDWSAQATSLAFPAVRRARIEKDLNTSGC